MRANGKRIYALDSWTVIRRRPGWFIKRTYSTDAWRGPYRSEASAALMIARNEGLTKTYNRFHARAETAPDIETLRALHADMDRAVLAAYGWHDLAAAAAPQFIEQDADDGKTPRTRLDWPSEFKDAVLARLLALNAARAAEERAAGVVADIDDEPDDEA